MPGARLIGAAGAIASLCAAAAAGGAGAAAVPNPCTLVSPAVVSSTVGLSSTLSGKLSTRPDGKVKQSLCTFTHGAATLEIVVAPHQPSGGYGGPPGMVMTHPSGLGTGATFAYGTNPRFLFANASFTKGSLDGGVYDNGKLPTADILSLAKIVYKALP